MRTIVHLSDLHFGHIDDAIVDPLIETAKAIRPDLVVVSGDLTQRARSGQFKAARAFLEALCAPWIVVPGNHDVPLYNLFARFLRPLANYRRYISDDLAPFHGDEEIAVLGINTARALTIKHGRINEEQIASIRERLAAHGDGITKILVTHHPLHAPERGGERAGRAPRALAALARCRVDVLLAGHLHLSHLGHTAERYRIGGYSALALNAGTATSTRVRGERNSFNVLRIERPHIDVRRFTWDPERVRFIAPSAEHFRHTPEGWVPVARAHSPPYQGADA
ncbi:MAG: metallophosphoesterase family protein [Gammaproteobacteria bacterium]